MPYAKLLDVHQWGKYTWAQTYQAHLYQVFAYIKDFLCIQISLIDSNVNVIKLTYFEFLHKWRKFFAFKKLKISVPECMPIHMPL